MANDKGRGGCWKTGCFGCAGVAGAVVLLFALLSFLQVQHERSGRPVEKVELSRDLPTLPDIERLVERGELGSGRELGTGASRESVFSSPEIAGHLGIVELDLDVGDFEIVANEPGRPLEVDAQYEKSAFRFHEDLQKEDDGSWTYRISLRPPGGMMGLVFRGAGNNPKNHVTIRLPRDQPMDLVGRVGLGEARIDLGGLLVRRVDLQTTTGEHEVRVSEPLQAPMELFRVRKSLGELRILELGNASPGEVDISQRIGELTVDLSGAWRQDASVRVTNGIGELNVEAPDDVHVVVDNASVGLGDRSVGVRERPGLPAGAPTLRLELHGRLGEVHVDN